MGGLCEDDERLKCRGDYETRQRVLQRTAGNGAV